MNPSVYIASTLANFERVQRIRDKFGKLGVDISYDWTKHCLVTDKTLLPAVADAEAMGVTVADAILFVHPGGKGAYFEYGLAVGSDKPVFMLGDKLDRDQDERPVAFNHLSSTTYFTDEDAAIAAVVAVVKKDSECLT